MENVSNLDQSGWCRKNVLGGIFLQSWLPSRPDYSQVNQPELTGNPPGINQRHARINEYPYVRSLTWLSDPTWTEYICARLLFMVAHLDRLLKIETDNHEVLQRWNALYHLDCCKVSKNKNSAAGVNKFLKNHALQWSGAIDCSFPCQFLRNSGWFLVGI